MKSRESSAVLQYWLREPTLHFFAIAAIIFAVYALNQSQTENVIEISQSEIDARIFLQELNRGAELTDAERDFITSTLIEERILVEEAKKMGLDNDARINDMLAQKMRHVLSGNVIQPSDDDLQGHYQRYRQSYEIPARLTAEELVFNSRDPLRPEVRQALAENAEPSRLLEMETGTVSPLPDVHAIDLANIFEPDFSAQVFQADVGQWVGPFISNRGQHWLRVQSTLPATLPSLSEIIDRVRMDWIVEEEDRLLQLEVDALWESYSITINQDQPSK